MDWTLRCNFCVKGHDALLEPIRIGLRALDMLTLSTDCVCLNKKHTWYCQSHFHNQSVKFSYEDVFEFVLKHRKKIRLRATLLSEATRLIPRLEADPLWVYSFYPAICDNEMYDDVIQRAAYYESGDNNLLMSIGVSKVPPMNPSLDAKLYIAMMFHPKDGAVYTIEKLGKYTRQYFKSVKISLDALPMELVIRIFELAYNCKMTAKCLSLLSF